MKRLIYVPDPASSSSTFWYRPPTSIAVSGGASGKTFYVQVMTTADVVQQQVNVAVPAGVWYINVPGYQQASTFHFRTSSSATGGGVFEAYTAGSGSPDQGYSSTLSVTSVTAAPLY